MRIKWLVRLGVVLLLITIGLYLWNDLKRRKIDHDCWQLAVAHSSLIKEKIVDNKLHMIIDHGKTGGFLDIYQKCKRVNGLKE